MVWCDGEVVREGWGIMYKMDVGWTVRGISIDQSPGSFACGIILPNMVLLRDLLRALGSLLSVDGRPLSDDFFLVSFFASSLYFDL